MSDNGRTASGRFAPGNQAAKGRGGEFSATAKAAASRAPGHTGVISWGGFVANNENSRLQGAEKWAQYANAYFRPAVAIAALLRWNLLSGLKWSLVPNAAGGRDAERGLEICQKGLLDADMPEPWAEVVAKAGHGSYFEGSSLHAWAMGRRKDGIVVFTELGHRPMHTVARWLRPDDTRPFEAVVQSIADGKEYVVPLSRCLYLVEKMFGDHPEGVGVLRLLLERGKRTTNYERIEGSEIFSSMGGMPIADVPWDDLEAEVAGMDEAEAAAHKKKAVAAIETVVAERIKTPEKQMYALINSAIYRSEDGNTLSPARKWNIRILKGELQGLEEVRKIINDNDLNDARILNVEFVFVGGNDSSGSYNMHESKLGLFARSVQNTANRVGVRGTQQLCRPLVAANGLDPDKATPRLVPEQLTISDVLRVAEMLGLMAKANLHPRDPARNILREREGLPPEPEEIVEEMLAPRGKVTDDELEDVDDLEEEPVKGKDVKPKEDRKA